MTPPTNPTKNLDIHCAELGRNLAAIPDMDEKTLNDALAVLEEQGPYAMFLYIRARHKKVARQFQEHCLKLLRGVFEKIKPENTDAIGAAQTLADDLDDLLFARELLRNALGYARYHLKAKGS